LWNLFISSGWQPTTAQRVEAAVLLNVITILEYQSHSSTCGLGRHITRHTEYFEEGNQVKIADKRAANKEAHAARERKAKTPDAASSPCDDQVTTVVFDEPPRERVGGREQSVGRAVACHGGRVPPHDRARGEA